MFEIAGGAFPQVHFSLSKRCKIPTFQSPWNVLADCGSILLLASSAARRES